MIDRHDILYCASGNWLGDSGFWASFVYTWLESFSMERGGALSIISSSAQVDGYYREKFWIPFGSAFLT